MRLAECRNEVGNVISLEGGKTMFYRSTQHRKSGQEVKDLLPVFGYNLFARRLVCLLLNTSLSVVAFTSYVLFLSIQIRFQILVKMLNQFIAAHSRTPHKEILVELIEPKSNFSISFGIPCNIAL